MAANQIATPRFDGFHPGTFNTYARQADGTVVATPHTIAPQEVLSAECR